MASTSPSDIYQHNFSIKGAKEIISTCLDNFDKCNPDSLVLLQAISKLTVMLNTAQYDYTVLENLILENEALSAQYRELEFSQISKNIEHLNFKVNALQEKCETLKENIKHYDYICTVSPQPADDPKLENYLGMVKLSSHNMSANLKLKA